MNERIEGLWWKARIGYNNQNCDPEVLEKFAELIVQECIDALWTEECHTSDLAVEDYNRNCRKIKEHFGEGDWITHSLSGKGGGAGVTVTKEGINQCQTYKSAQHNSSYSIKKEK